MLKSMRLPSNLPLLWPLIPHLLVLAPLGTWECWELVKRLHLLEKLMLQQMETKTVENVN